MENERRQAHPVDSSFSNGDDLVEIDLREMIALLLDRWLLILLITGLAICAA